MVMRAGMVAERLTPHGYQDLLDRGWRRSGTYLYRPRIEGQCCAHYTIRQDATQFEPSASHKRVLRRFDAFLAGAWAAKQAARHAASGAVLASPPATGDQGAASGLASAGHTASTGQATTFAATAAGPCGDLFSGAMDSPVGEGGGGGDCMRLAQTPSNPEQQQLSTEQDDAVRELARRLGQGLGAALQALGEPPWQECAAIPCAFAVAPRQGVSDTQDGTAVVRLRSALCWQAASRECTAPPAAQQESKAAAKRRRRAAAKQAGTASGGGVATRAAELADATALPALRAVVRADAALSAAVTSMRSERGHLCVDVAAPPLRTDAAVAAADVQRTSMPCSAAGHLLQHRAPRTLSVPAAAAQNGGSNDASARQNSAACSGARTDAKRARPLQSHCVSASAGSSGALPAAPTQAPRSSGPSSDASMATERSDEESGSSDRWEDDGSRGGASEPEDAADEPPAQRHKWWLEAPPPGGWPFRTTLQRSRFRRDEFELWRRYQHAVHGDAPHKTARRNYERFLVDNPFPASSAPHSAPTPSSSETPVEGAHAVAGGGEMDAAQGSECVRGAPRCGYGAFHMQYWIAEHLVAVGVVDILPRCAASAFVLNVRTTATALTVAGAQCMPSL